MVGNYIYQAESIINKLFSEKKNVIIAGGSNYYAESLLYKTDYQNKDNLDITDEDRAYLRSLIDKEMISEAKTTLQDKYGFSSQFHANDTRRLKNEIMRLVNQTGIDIDRSSLRYPNCKVIYLNNSERPFIEYLVSKRIKSMLYNNKAIEEIFYVLNKTVGEEDSDDNYGVLQAIGYKEFIPLFRVYQKSEIGKTKDIPSIDDILTCKELNNSLLSCIEILNRNTLRLVKKQKTWINNRILKNETLNGCLYEVEVNKSKMVDGQIDDYFNSVVKEIESLFIGNNELKLLQQIKITEDTDLAKCKECDIEFNSEKSFKQHRKSKIHKKTKQLPDKYWESKVTGELVECLTCQRQINKEYLPFHLKSKGHRRKLKKQPTN